MLDLRSDFLTRPTAEMITAMNEAALTPPAFGLREDKHVQILERRAAEVLGKEDALFCPTCTQANQIAINVHVSPGESVAAEADAHIFTSEAGAYSALSGAVAAPVQSADGHVDLAHLASVVESPAGLGTKTGLVVLENTHVRSGGRVIPEEVLSAAYAVARQADTPLHLDGARLPNAAVALGCDLTDLSRHSDSVSLSLNKGLGAPLGAILAGTAEFIEAAVQVRQRFGGGWRPAGIPAAAALLALEGWGEWIAEDHVVAKLLGEALAEVPGVVIDQDQVQSNLVLAAVEGMTAQELTTRLARASVLVLPYLSDAVRIAIYRDVTRGDVGRIVEAFRAAG